MGHTSLISRRAYSAMSHKEMYIHAKMYEIATQNWTTVEETQGGSENFQEGPGGWNSGTGLAQFKR